MAPLLAPEPPKTISSGANIIVNLRYPITETPILSYNVSIKCADGTWASTSYCDGFSPEILANQYCIIP